MNSLKNMDLQNTLSSLAKALFIFLVNYPRSKDRGNSILS